jgi:hypothetical protein
MQQKAICKFCHRPGAVIIDDGYAELGDPYKIIPLYCCDRCADLRVERRNLEARIGKGCSLAALLPEGQSKQREAIRSILERLTKAYARMVARWNHMDGELWESALVEQMMEKPNQWGQTLGQLWRMPRQLQREQAQESLPYKDA